MHRVVSDYSRPQSADDSNIKVFVRPRPIDETLGVPSSDFIITDTEDDRKITIKDPDPNNRKYSEVGFQFDKIFSKDQSQEDVFQAVCQPQVEHVLNGFNCCCFAYGQTGSGKTYSMFGLDGDIRGLIPRSVEYIFKRLKEKTDDFEVAIACSFLEIYNDQIRDLGKAYLAAMGVQASNPTAMNEKTSDIFEKFANKRGNSFFANVFHTSPRNSNAISSPLEQMPGLKEVIEGYQAMNYEIREDAEGNVFVKDLSLIPVTTLEEIMSIITLGLRVRATHETKMNTSSSRSHTIFSINVVQRNKATDSSISGNLNLVDLAGSERLKKSESQGQRLKEALHINSSLTCLGKVIMALDPTSVNTHIPYRESKLTRILQNSLGGNSFTTVIAAIHPSPTHYEECLSTLQFANRCRNVRNNPRVNYIFDNEDKDRQIKRLMDEIVQLRSRINQLEFLLKEAKGGKAIVEKIRRVFKVLGMDVVIDKNGTLLYDNEKFDVAHIMNDTSADINDQSSNRGDDDSHASGAQFSPRSLKLKSSNSIMDEKTLKTITELQDANMDLSKKNKEKKIIVEEQSRRITDLENEIAKLRATNQHIKHETTTQLREKEENYKLLLSGMKVSYDNDIKEILSHNDVFLENHHRIMESIPKTLTSYTTQLEKLNNMKHTISEKFKQEFNEYLKELELTRHQELNTLQAEFACYLREKDSLISELVEKFNLYRGKKTAYIEQCEKEIISLCDHNNKLEAILDDVEAGKYRMKQFQTNTDDNGITVTTDGLGITSLTGHLLSSTINQIRPATAFTAVGSGQGNNPTTLGSRRTSSVGAIVLPKGLRPGNKGTSLSKKIYDKHIQTTTHLETMRQASMKKTLNKVASTGSLGMFDIGPCLEDDPVLQDQIGEFVKMSQTKKREALHSAPTKRGGGRNTNDSINSRPKSQGQVTLPPVQSARSDIHASPSRAESNQGVFLSESLYEDSGNQSTLNHKLLRARQHIRELELEKEAYLATKRLEDVAVDKLSEEMSSNKTLAYITELEMEQESLRRQLQETAAQLHNSKIANAALRRKGEKPSLFVKH